MSSNASSSEAEESSDTEQNQQDDAENQVQFPTKEDAQPEIITDGEFEKERQVSAEQAGQFLDDIGFRLHPHGGLGDLGRPIDDLLVVGGHRLHPHKIGRGDTEMRL